MFNTIVLLLSLKVLLLLHLGNDQIYPYMKKLENIYQNDNDRIVVSGSMLISRTAPDNMVCYAPIVVILSGDRIVIDMFSKEDEVDTFQYLKAFSDAATQLQHRSPGLYCATFNIYSNGSVNVPKISGADNYKTPIAQNSSKEHLKRILELEAGENSSYTGSTDKKFAIVEPMAARKHALETAALLLGDPTNWSSPNKTSNPLCEHRLRSELITGIALEYLLELRQRDRNMDVNEWITKLAI